MVQGHPAPAAATGWRPHRRGGAGGGAPGPCSPGAGPWLRAAPNTTEVSPEVGRGGRPHSPGQPHGPVVGEVSRGQDSRQLVQGRGRGSEAAVVAAACTWCALWDPAGARGLGSAQALVQVGRGEEGVGSQAHGQEALDQGGAEATFERAERPSQRHGGQKTNPGWGCLRSGPPPGPPEMRRGPAGPPTPKRGHLVRSHPPEGLCPEPVPPGRRRPGCPVLAAW